MKKVVLVLLAMVFVIGLLMSCNKSVCPAYVKDVPAEQAENNG
jgi:energy-converting hydrogenase Eha subunit F